MDNMKTIFFYAYRENETELRRTLSQVTDHPGVTYLERVMRPDAEAPFCFLWAMKVEGDQVNDVLFELSRTYGVWDASVAPERRIAT